MRPWQPQARQLASESKIARLATVDEAGQPHAVPICFVLIGERLYTIVDQKPKRNPSKLKRLRNISTNPRVAVIIDHYEDNWENLRYLMVRGSASVVSAADEFADALSQLRVKYSQYVGMDLVMESNPMLRIDIDKTHFWSASPVPDPAL